MESTQKIQKITPFLWFDTQAEEAVNFYTSVFKNAKKGVQTHYPEGSFMPAGSVLTQVFELEGIGFVALNGGPKFSFNPAISFVVNCENQEEIDYFWEQLATNGKTDMCGWLTDQFGISWQIVPHNIHELVQRPEAFTAMMGMQKLDIVTLKNAGKE